MQALIRSTAALLLASAAICQVTIPPHASTYNGFSRGFNFTAQNNFLINQLELPLNAQQVGDTASFLVRINGAVAFYSTGTTGPTVATSLVINPGDVVDVIGNWSPAVPGNFTAHNSYGNTTPYATTIEGVPHTLNRTGWQWDIGDPLYTSGTYLAPVAGQMGRILMYTSPPSGLYANFTSNVQAGSLPLTVNFTDSTFTSDPGGVTSWAWDFDGDSVIDSTVQNPSFVYSTCGAYNVTLTVTDASHTPSTITKNGYIQAGIAPITPSFTYAAIAPSVFQFTDTSTPAPASWAWDLDGDGLTDSTAQNPVWAYSSPCTGVNVRLSVSSNCAGPWTTTKAIVLSPLSATAVPFLGGNGTTSATFVGNMFDLSVTNPAGISVCAITQGVYTYVGPFHADIYITDGTYLGKEANAAAWRLVASGNGTSAGGAITPSTGYPVALNQSFYLPAGNYGMVVFLSQPAGAMYVSYTNAPQGPFVTPDVTFNPNPGTAPGRVSTTLFTGAGIVGRCWNGTLHYSTLGNGDLAGYGFFGPGCAGSMGVTTLAHNAPPALGSTLSVTMNHLPQSAAIMMTGFSNTASIFGPLPLSTTPYGAPGCFARVSTDATLFLFGAGNNVVWNFGIPNAPGLIGVQMYNQALVLDPGFNALGAVLSDATGMMIGL